MRKSYEDRQKELQEEEKKRQEERRALLLPPETDLRPICRESDRCNTVIEIFPDWDVRGVWLRLGQVNIVRAGEHRPGEWRLEAYFRAGVTDVEHDSAKAIVLPLIGLQLDALAVHYHQTNLVAWVNPNDEDGFRVPGSGYDPTKLKGAHRCKDPDCLRDDPKGHIIVPPGFYTPPENKELFEKVKGKRIEIRVGPSFKDED